jgi:hypothetical protein
MANEVQTNRQEFIRNESLCMSDLPWVLLEEKSRTLASMTPGSIEAMGMRLRKLGRVILVVNE